jgi:hypothetical protein
LKKVLKWIVRIVLGLVVVVILLLAGGFVLINTPSFQNKLLKRATTMLADKLQTKVEIDSVSINLLTLDAELYGLELEDRQQRKMLSLELLQTDVDLWPLIRNDEIRISQATIKGVRAELHHTPNDTIDSIANYQFVIDAFKKDKKKGKAKKDSVAKKKKFSVALKKLRVENIDVTYNGYGAKLGRLLFSQPDENTMKVAIEQLSAQWERTNKKKGYQVSDMAAIGRLYYQDLNGRRTVDISDLRYKNDNHRPRKNVGKPKRGFFDHEHLNVTAQLKAVIDHVGKDTLHATLKEMTATDPITGIDIRDIHGGVGYNKDGLQLENFVIRQTNTTLSFDRGHIQLPSKKTGRKLAYSTSTIKGRTLLQDIARPFAPVLSKFTLPLNLSVSMSGDDNSMMFRNAKVWTDDKMLTISAKGHINNLKDAHLLRVHFDVDQMVAKGGIKEKIINQFPVKKFMMEQLRALGTIQYHGFFDVLWKREEFQGLLSTKAGNLNFKLALDETNKYVLGTASTQELKLGEVMNMSAIGPISAKADFKFDISKPRTAMMRRKKGGKLPIGEIQAFVKEASYRFAKVTNLTVNIVSDGAIAEGSLHDPGKYVDLSCTFTFTNTNEMQKMKVKPSMKVHKLIDTKKLKDQFMGFFKSDTPEEEKLLKKAEKEARKQQKAEEKAARKQQKAEEKARKKEEKAARKQQEAAEKAARKQKAAEEKAARKSE